MYTLSTSTGRFFSPRARSRPLTQLNIGGDALSLRRGLAVEVYDVHIQSVKHATKDGYHHGDLRNALIEAATQLVGDVGVDEFSLRDAARRVGVSPNATYRHFESKADLLTAVALGGFEKLAQRMRRRTSDAMRAHANETPAEVAIECFKASGRAYLAFADEFPELFRLMYGPNGLCRFGRTALPDGSPAPLQILGEALDALVSTGLLPAERRAGAELKAWSVVHGLVSLPLGGMQFPTVARRAEALEALLDFALDGLCHEGPSTKRPRKPARVSG
jgi:AcrR family transcriptional regulator